MQAHPALPVQIHETSSRPILFSARTPQAHTPISLHPCHGPPRRSSKSSLLINSTSPAPSPGPCLSARPPVRPSVRYAEAQLQSNNPTYEQTQCQNPLRPRTVVRDATLPRTSDQIASLRTKIINTKSGVSVPIPIPIAAPIPVPVPIPTPQTTRASHSFNSGKPLPIPQDIRHRTQATTPRDPVRIRVRVRARDRMDSGAPPVFLFIPSFFSSASASAFCFLLVHPRSPGLGPPSSPTTSTALLDNRNYLCLSQAALCPLARLAVSSTVHRNVAAFSNKAP